MIGDDRPLVLLIGATGTIGSAVIHELGSRARIRVLVRTEASEAAVVRRYPAAECVYGDLRDPETLPLAFHGIDRVFLLTPSVADQARLEANALGAALAADPQRIVYLSSTDVRWDLQISAAHQLSERTLARSRVEHTIVRAEYLLDNLLSEIDELAAGRLIAPSGVMRCPFVDARDVGAVAAAALLADAAPPGPLEVTGPRALTWSELAETLGQTLGRNIEHVDPEPAEWARSAMAAGLDPWLAGALQEYFTVVRRHALEASGDVMRVTRRSPRSVDNFAREVLAPAVRRYVVPPRPGYPRAAGAATVLTPERRQHA